MRGLLRHPEQCDALCSKGEFHSSGTKLFAKSAGPLVACAGGKQYAVQVWCLSPCTEPELTLMSVFKNAAGGVKIGRCIGVIYTHSPGAPVTFVTLGVSHLLRHR